MDQSETYQEEENVELEKNHQRVDSRGELMSNLDSEDVRYFEETKEMQLWKASLSETMQERFQGFQLTKEFLKHEQEKIKRK